VCEAHRSGEAFRRPWNLEPDCQIQILSSLFFRNKGAYIVGASSTAPASLHWQCRSCATRRGQLYLDTALFTSEQLATLFSFTRAYFLVDMEAPSAYIEFLRSILPHKPPSELYTMVGLAKQGKTLFTATSCTT